MQLNYFFMVFQYKVEFGNVSIHIFDYSFIRYKTKQSYKLFSMNLPTEFRYNLTGHSVFFIKPVFIRLFAFIHLKIAFEIYDTFKRQHS